MGIELLRDKRFLITGSTGCLGSLAAARLEELGAEVFPVAAPGYPARPKRSVWKAKAEPLIIKSKDDLEMLPEADYVINFHWNTNRELNFSGQLFNEIKRNIRDLEFVWEWAAENTAAKFINISSVGIYSILNGREITESDEPRPLTPYGIAKQCAENYFDAVFHNSPFSTLHLRLCSVMCPGEHPSHLMTQLYKSAYQGRQMKLRINRSTYLMAADEIIDYIISASLKDIKGKLNLVKNSYDNEELARLFSLLTGKALNMLYEAGQEGQPEISFSSSISLLTEDWIRTQSIEDAILEFVNSYNALVPEEDQNTF